MWKTPGWGTAKVNEDPKVRALQRTEWGMRFVHELVPEVLRKMSSAAPLQQRIRDFGYGQPDCQVINYWTGDDRLPGQPVIVCSNPKVKWIGLWKPEERDLLVVLVNWDDDPQETRLTVEHDIVGHSGVPHDDETGEPITEDQMNLMGREVKFVRIAFQEEVDQ